MRDVPDVRHARAADLRHIAGIEDAGLALFEAHFGDLTGDVLASSALSGGSRLDAPGFLLVSGRVGEPTGFAHVVEIEGFVHLEQLSVHPDAMRQGIGTSLVRAALAESRALGFARLSLCTYRDLPWNGPFYVGLGFGRSIRSSPSSAAYALMSRRSGWIGTARGWSSTEPVERPSHAHPPCAGPAVNPWNDARHEL